MANTDSYDDEESLWLPALRQNIFAGGGLLPADGPAFVLLLQPAHQRLVVFEHRTRGEILAGRFLQDFAPVFGRTLQSRAEEALIHGMIPPGCP